MDTLEKAKRPWWRKKRWRLFVVFWLVLPIAYPLSAGPVYYAIWRGWMNLAATGDPPGLYERLYSPLDEIVDGTFLWNPYRAYLHWWADLALRHNAQYGGPRF